MRKTFAFAAVSSLMVLTSCARPVADEPAAVATDPLPSWNEGAAKDAVLDFVDRVTDPAGPAFVAEPERIAVFDNDGTLWAERPIYFQLLFAMDRVKAMAPDHPEWATTQPFMAVLEDDKEAVAASGVRGILELVMATHAGMTTAEFEAVVTDWLATARHPSTGSPYTEMVYQPMLELLAYLRENGFKTFIVSGGGIEFMRPWTEAVYGIPPEQVVGSSIQTKFEMRGDGPPLLCDGTDNDCSGTADEGCPCDYDDNSDGVCSNGTISDEDESCLAPAEYVADEISPDLDRTEMLVYVQTCPEINELAPIRFEEVSVLFGEKQAALSELSLTPRTAAC